MKNNGKKATVQQNEGIKKDVLKGIVRGAVSSFTRRLIDELLNYFQ